MLINLRNALMAGDETPQYVGVELVGSSVTLTNGVLANFSAGSYAKLPFMFGTMDKSWEVVGCFKPSSATVGAVFGGLGNTNGWTPIYLRSGSGGNVASYINNVGWPVEWDTHPVSDIWSGALFSVGLDNFIRIRFDGTNLYDASSIVNGAWVVSATKTSANKCNANNLNIQMGTNRGTSNPIEGSIDLNYCYVRYDGRLLWEGVTGAYRNVKRIIV